MTYSILLADDEELEREALKLFIEEAKLPINKIIEAENGNMIVDKALNEKPDIIILDINMPGKTGLEALKIIREQKNHSKVIVSTAFSKIDNAIDAIHLGVVDFLIKPVSQQIFIESLKKTIETLDDEKNINPAKVTKDNTDGVTINEPDMVKKVCAYIETNYSKKISLNDISDHCGYSKFHLSRIFKAYKDITVIDYLISHRIQISKKLLSGTNDSVKQISAQVGFSDPNYFTWTFKKLEGVSPMQYRAMNLPKS